MKDKQLQGELAVGKLFRVAALKASAYIDLVAAFVH